MKKKLIVKYLSIVFVFATLLATLHHHNDFQEHNDCQICTIQNSIADADTPSDTIYITLLTLPSKRVITHLQNLQAQVSEHILSARAPPLFS